MHLLIVTLLLCYWTAETTRLDDICSPKPTTAKLIDLPNIASSKPTVGEGIFDSEVCPMAEWAALIDGEKADTIHGYGDISKMSCTTLIHYNFQTNVNANGLMFEDFPDKIDLVFYDMNIAFSDGTTGWGDKVRGVCGVGKMDILNAQMFTGSKVKDVRIHNVRYAGQRPIDVAHFFAAKKSRLKKVYLSCMCDELIFSSPLFSANYAQLQTLSLVDMCIRYLSPTAFANLLNLKVIDLSENSLLELEQPCFLGLSLLSSVSLRMNGMDHIHLEQFIHIKSLKSISLDGNPIGEISGAFLPPSMNLISLKNCSLRVLCPLAFTFDQKATIDVTENPIQEAHFCLMNRTKLIGLDAMVKIRGNDSDQEDCNYVDGHECVDMDYKAIPNCGPSCESDYSTCVSNLTGVMGCYCHTPDPIPNPKVKCEVLTGKVCSRLGVCEQVYEHCAKTVGAENFKCLCMIGTWNGKSCGNVEDDHEGKKSLTTRFYVSGGIGITLFIVSVVAGTYIYKRKSEERFSMVKDWMREDQRKQRKKARLARLAKASNAISATDMR